MSLRREKVYSQLYKIVEQNMIMSGKEMKFGEKTFLSTLGEQGNVADVLFLQENEPQIFQENIYMQLLGRFPDDRARKQWESEKKEDLKIKKNIVRAIISSDEFLMVNSYLKNNIYVDVTSKKESRTRDIKHYLIKLVKPVVRRLPYGVKEAIKRFLKMA